MKLRDFIARLRSAVSRHGLLGVVGVVLTIGPSRVVRCVGTGESMSAAPAPKSRSRGDARRLALASDLTLPAADWARWARRAAPPSAGDAQGVQIVYVTGALGEASDAISALHAPRDDVLYVFLQAGDTPDPDLPSLLIAQSRAPDVEIVTFDLYRRLGDRVQPLFRPGANTPLLEAGDYLFSRVAVKGSFLRAHPPGEGGLRGSILAWAASRTPAQTRAGWKHLPLPLVCAALADDALSAWRDSLMARLHQPARHEAASPVSVVICTRDKGRLMRQLMRSLLALGPDQIGEVVVVSNGATNPFALQTLADIQRDPRVRVIQRDEPFNFSRLSNAGVRQTRGRGPLLFLNDDITPVSDDWLAVLRARLQTPGTGAVGPLLLYPREQVQHAGMYLRHLGGAGHTLRGALLPDDDPMGLCLAEREVSCLTGAVLLTDRAAFEQAGGFDEALAIGLQDVDYGLKLYRAGMRNVFEPRAVLLHMESASIGGIVEDPAVARQRHAEWRLFMERWADLVDADPFRVAGFDPEDESLRRLKRR